MKSLFFSVLALAALLPTHLNAQLHDRIAQRAAASGQVQYANGGTSIELAASYDVAYSTLIDYLNKGGATVEDANKEIGHVATALEISGGYHQTGKRMTFTILKTAPEKTTIRVAVTTQKRYKALSTDSWSDPKVDDKASSEYADKLKSDLSAALSAKN